MRVMMIHNFYRSELPSGENRSVLEEVDHLRAAGVEVIDYFRESDTIAQFSMPRKVELTWRPVLSRSDGRALARLIAERRPDVVHVQNPFPLISPTALAVASRAGVPVVQAVRNVRFTCMAASFYRDGASCRLCAGRALGTPGVRFGCYRGSRPQSAVMAVALARQRHLWRRVDRFLPISEYIAGVLVDEGVDRGRITVKPNVVPAPPSVSPLGRGFLYAGRLEAEKGVRMLLEAWRDADVPSSHRRLVIVGDGGLRAEVEDAAASDATIRFLGPVPPERVASEIRASAVVVVPSLLQEAFGRTAIEAFAHGRPALATRVGGLAEIVDETVGWQCSPTVEGLRSGMQSVTDHGLEGRARAARRRYQDRFSPEHSVGILLDVYAQLTSRR